MIYRPWFGAIGKATIIIKPMFIRNSKCIYIGDRCSIRNGARLEVIRSDEVPTPRLEIGSETSIEQHVHIICRCKVTIGKNVSITPRCTIVDTIHPFTDVEKEESMGSRIDNSPSFVEIGDQAFLGAGVVVMPNVRIGKYCIVGANSVVTKSLPDYSVCAGSPARVIKQYDFNSYCWERVVTPPH